MSGLKPLINNLRPAETTVSLDRLMNELSLVPGMDGTRARLINQVVEAINGLKETTRGEIYEDLLARDFWVNRSHGISRREKALSALAVINPDLDASALADPSVLLTLISYLVRHAYPDGKVEVVEGEKPKMPPIKIKTITFDS